MKKIRLLLALLFFVPLSVYSASEPLEIELVQDSVGQWFFKEFQAPQISLKILDHRERIVTEIADYRVENPLSVDSLPSGEWWGLLYYTTEQGEKGVGWFSLRK